MQQTLTLAKRGRLTVSPNPMVGCIIVKNGAIVGEGWHQKAGEPHAEVYALRQAGATAKGATAYVSLEPCCHTGKTGPCSDALIKAGISKVVIATLDPNPMVAGKGVAKLQKAGVQTTVGILEKQAQKLNKIFFFYQQNQKPYVFAKWAMSLDGKTAVNSSDSKQISSEKSRIYTHQIRNICDAIIVGKNTLLDDNPKLDVRVGVATPSNPIRFVIFSKLEEIDADWHILDTTTAKTVFVCTEISAQVKISLQKLDIEYWVLDSLELLLEKMAQIGITSVLIEGGKKILESFITQGLINEYIAYVSPVLIAGLDNKQKLQMTAKGLGSDIVINAKPKGESDV